MKQKLLVIGCVFLSLIWTHASDSPAAELRLGSIFKDHMVLQREQPIGVWGEAAPNAAVKVTIAGEQAAATVGADGRWQVRLPPISKGGPYQLAVSAGGRTLELNDILCGDVWICSGQSNMQMPVQECDASEQAATLTTRPKLRLCTVARAWNAKPQTLADIQWRTCTPENARSFSAVGYFFACELLKGRRLKDVPIGLIDSSFGGTTCEGWIPQAALGSFSSNQLHDSMFGIKPAMLYNAMIAPLGPAHLKGVIWYQGESNSGHPETYPRLMATMIAEWRRQFEDPKLPFLLVQLPDYARKWDGFYWPWEREAQQQVARSVPQTAMAVGIGTTDGFDLHPKQKLEIGRRLALLARREVYKENVVASGPVFEEATIEGPRIRVRFDTGGGELASSAPGGVRGFAVAGDDQVYHFANVTLDGDSATIECDAVPAPKTVRYAWAGAPNSTLINKLGLPAAPFRTDDFPYSNIESQKEPASRRVSTSSYDVVIDGNGSVTSLIVHDAQFISNEAGTSGGSSIPGFLGPRSLSNIRELGPRILSCSDDQVTVRMEFEEKTMEWTIANRGKDAVKFQVSLSPRVRLDPGLNQRLILRDGISALCVDGADSTVDGAKGKFLVTDVPGGAKRRIVFNTETNL